MDPDVRDLLVLAIPTVGTVLVAYFKSRERPASPPPESERQES